MEPGRRGDPRGRRLSHAAGEAGGGAQGARRPGLRRARQAPVRGPVAARPADRGHPLRRPARGARPPDDGRSTTRSTAASSRTCSKSARSPTTPWTPAASHRIREDMERAEARRLQPHYIESFFLEAFQRLGGIGQAARAAPLRGHPRPGAGAQPRPPDRHRRAGAAALRAHRLREVADRAAGPAAGRLRLSRPSAARRASSTSPSSATATCCKRGTVLVDERDPGTTPRVLFYLEHAIQDASLTRSGERRVVSKRMLYVELDADGDDAPPPLRALSRLPAAGRRASRASRRSSPGPSAHGSTARLEQKAQGYAIAHVVPEHLAEVRDAQARAASPRPRRR